MTNTGVTAHRYKLGTDPKPYPRKAYERRRGHLLLGIRIGQYMHIVRFWRQEDGR